MVMLDIYTLSPVRKNLNKNSLNILWFFIPSNFKVIISKSFAVKLYYTIELKF